MSKLSGYKPNKVAGCLEQKLGIAFRSSKELVGWYCLEGKRILRVSVPKGHGTRDVSERRVKRIIGDLRLDKDEFHDLYRCPMTGLNYENKIRHLIESSEV